MPAVTVQLFASYAESFGAHNIEVELPDRSTVADLVARLRTIPGSFVLPPTLRLAINQKFATSDQPVGSTDEIALIPPVAGG